MNFNFLSKFGSKKEKAPGDKKESGKTALLTAYLAASLSMLHAADPAEMMKFKGISDPEKNRSLAKELLSKYGKKISVHFSNPDSKNEKEKQAGIIRTLESDGHRFVYSEKYLKDGKTVVASYIDEDMNGSLDEIIVTENGQITYEAGLNNGAGGTQMNGASAQDMFEGDNKGTGIQTDADSVFGSGLDTINLAKDKQALASKSPTDPTLTASN
jgi:hypothetical protein